MVREIREAMACKKADPHFDDKELERIKAKWTKLLEEQKKTASENTSIAAEPLPKYGKK